MRSIIAGSTDEILCRQYMQTLTFQPTKVSVGTGNQAVSQWYSTPVSICWYWENCDRNRFV